MLKLDNIVFSIKNKIILDGLNLNIKKNEIHSILGVNGTGKSTLAYLIMGVNGYKPQKGEIVFEKQVINNFSITKRSNLGITMQWQHPAKFEGITVMDYLKAGNKEQNIHNIRKMLECVGLSPDSYLNRFVDNTLSGGERKRIELASLLLLSKKLVILDEPDSGIDAVSISTIMNIIKKFKELGSSVLLITHREEISNISDRTSLLHKGRILMTDKPKIVNKFFAKNFEKGVK